ncbi:MAG: HAMP domain-containing sensor histidine kinase [Fibrobacterota bacterium]
MGWAQLLELMLVGAGAFAHLHIVLARSSSAKAIWFNRTLYAWSLCWTIWYALVFSSLNLETIGYYRIPYLTAFTDILKGAILNLQLGIGLHGLSQMTGSLKKVPAWVWYVFPVGLIGWGLVRIATHPMVGFLENVEPVVRLFLAADIAAGAIAVYMLGQGMKHMDESQKGVARPLRKALMAMIPLLGGALAIKFLYGFEAVGRYRWVLLHDLAHLLPPFTLLWATFRTETVALDITLASWRRLRTFAGVFTAYILAKFAWPLSSLDIAASWAAAGLGLASSMGPLSVTTARAASDALNLGKQRESRLLRDLEQRLRRTTLPDEAIPRYLARCIGRILDARWRVKPLDKTEIVNILQSRAIVPGPETPTRILSLSTTTTRAEVDNWARLQARWILPMSTRDNSWAIVLGASSRMENLPAEIVALLDGLLATCQQMLLSRETLRHSLQTQRRLEEGERLAMLGLMAASAAHEIKNPLSAIRNVAMAARRDAPTDSVLSRDLDVVVGEVDRLDSTVRRMLHFARDRSVCEDAPETLRVVGGLLAVEARQKGIALDLSVHDEKTPLPISENDLKAILFNLVLNALNHAPRDSRVKVAFDADHRAISVTNEGEIPDDFRHRLFQPLATRGGTGLGLYISKSKAVESGGRLEYVFSPGHTTFRLSWEQA